MDEKYKFTVFTPCYNSSSFITRVFESLNKQDYRNFEWYVINDASTDNTHELITNYISNVSFPVIYINLEKNQGLLNNINQAIKDCNGDFILFYGHDDEMRPSALSTFNKVLLSHNTEKISAVYALAQDQNNKLVGKKYPSDLLVSNYWEQMFALNNMEEKFQCFKVKYLRDIYPIDTSEEKAQISAWLWGMLGAKYNAIFINKVLRTYYTNVDNSITKLTSRKDSNPIPVFNYYAEWVNTFQYRVKGNLKARYRGVAAYISYALLAKKNLLEIVSPIDKVSNKVLLILFYPMVVIYNFVKK